MTSTPSPKAASVSQGVIETDPHDPTREYIPLPGGWEVQTKGAGSSYRLLDKKTGERHLILTDKDWKPLQAFFTRFAHEVHAASASPEAPSRDAAVPASGGVDWLVERLLSWPCTGDDRDGKSEAYINDLMRQAARRLSASPAPTSGSEPVAYASAEQIAGLVADRPGDGGGVYLPLRKTPAGLFQMPLYALAKPASEPAGGRVRKYVPHDTFERIVREAADEIAGGQSVRDVLRGAITLALSSAPATPSPIEAEAKEGRADG